MIALHQVQIKVWGIQNRIKYNAGGTGKVQNMYLKHVNASVFMKKT